MADRFLVTFFPSQSAQRKTVEFLTLEQLRDKIQTTTASSKAALPWLKFADFGNKRSDKNCLRHNANVLSITGIELDYDQEQVTLDAAIAVIKKSKLLALLYTSASYSDATPRWRILLPTSTTLPPDERTKLVARVNGLFGGVFSPESFTLSQSYYFGAVNGNPAHRAVYTAKGDYIDRRGDLDVNALGKVGKKIRSNGTSKQSDASQYEKPPVAKVRAALVAIRKGDVDRNKWVSIGHALKFGMGEDGLELFTQFSSTWPDGDYDEEYTINKWESFKPTGDVTIGTVFYYAEQVSPGWQEAYEELEWQNIIMMIRKNRLTSKSKSR